MALNSYAELTINGEELDGDTSISEIAGIDVSSHHLECFSVRWASRLKSPSSAGRVRSTVKKQPVILLKPLDKSTPLLHKALATNQRIDGTIKIFGFDTQSGETHHFFSLKLDQARIVSLESISANTLSTDTATLPPTEQVELIAQTLTYIDVINDIEYEDR